MIVSDCERRAHLRGSEYATICAFVQECCCGLSGGVVDGGAGGGSSSNDKLTESGKIRYLYDRNKDQTFFTACVEANIHLVVTFERRVQERESTVHAFFNDVLNGLRGTKLFQQEIKTFGK
ncbi:hypothetical protein GPALN_014407 [Globodera pallida]|nr:hypothetical protein GPALN_014404 [Globodera pallida]KAI3420786.1 hypothetical protein GPALN_014407 [Globodera pallida]